MSNWSESLEFVLPSNADPVFGHAAIDMEKGKYLNVWKNVDGEWKIYLNIWNANAPEPAQE